MARNVSIEFSKTYANTANAERAVAKVLGAAHEASSDGLRYMIVPVGARFGVLFIGAGAVMAGMHFHFNCVA